MNELLEKYLQGDMSAISLIRALSGVFNPEFATDILVLICQITRVEQGDLSKEVFRSMYTREEESEDTDEKSN